jgi:hypothetical protein
MRKKDLDIASKTLRRHWEKYRGQHVLVVGTRVYAAKTGKKAKQIYRELERKHPKVPPLITYVPEKGSLILWS